MVIIAISLGVKAAFWGLIAGSALIVDALLAYFTKVLKKSIAFIMAFGSGVLISSLAFNLMDEADKRGGFDSTALGFVCGAVVYSVANYFLNKKGGKTQEEVGESAIKRR